MRAGVRVAETVKVTASDRDLTPTETPPHRYRPRRRRPDTDAAADRDTPIETTPPSEPRSLPIRALLIEPLPNGAASADRDAIKALPIELPPAIEGSSHQPSPAGAEGKHTEP